MERKLPGKKVPKIWLYLARLSSFCRLRTPPRLAFLAWGDFHARSRFALSTIPEDKWGTTRSLSFWRFWKILFLSLLEVAEIQTRLFGWMESAQHFFFFLEKKNVLDRCNKVTYTIPFVMNEHSVYWVIKATWTKIRQLFNFSKVVP